MIQIEMKSLSPDHGRSAILSKELVSMGEARMSLRRKEPGSELCFGEVNLPLVKKRMGKKGDWRDSLRNFQPTRAQR